MQAWINLMMLAALVYPACRMAAAVDRWASRADLRYGSWDCMNDSPLNINNPT